MNWKGKVIGAIVAFIIHETLFSITLGIIIGHLFDLNLIDVDLNKWLKRDKIDDNELTSTFFSTIFSMMGHIAKTDGQVTRLEIDVAQSIMTKMALNPKRKKVAVSLYNQGKQKDFAAEATLMKFKQSCAHRDDMVQNLLEALALTALANGHLGETQNNILRKYTAVLGVSTKEYRNLLKKIRARQPYQTQSTSIASGKDRTTKLNEAYLLLEINVQSDNKKIKQAYHRQMNRHHPDKLIAKGLPQESIDLANKKAQEIKSAYELIKSCRKSSAL